MASQVSLWPEKKAQYSDWLNLPHVLFGAAVRVEGNVGDFVAVADEEVAGKWPCCVRVHE